MILISSDLIGRESNASRLSQVINETASHCVPCNSTNDGCLEWPLPNFLSSRLAFLDGTGALCNVLALSLPLSNKKDSRIPETAGMS
jgi:hypothetical protein